MIRIDRALYQTNEMIMTALEICEILNSLGDAYIVGGAVRDLWLNREVNDVDICTTVPMDVIEKKFVTADIGKNKTFGIVVVVYKEFRFEIAQMRGETDQPGTALIDTDLAHRDFTINAMAMGSDGSVIAPYSSENVHFIEAVENPKDRFREDPLRLLRAIRFSVLLELPIEQDTQNAIIQYGSLIESVAPERIIDELSKLAKHGGIPFARAIALSQELQLLEHVLPEIAVMEQYEQPQKWHPEGNVFIHTLKALESLEKGTPVDVIFAVLFHDIGKPVAYQFRKGKHTFYGHDSKGIAPFKKVAKRFRLSNRIKQTTLFCIQNHMKMHVVHEMRPEKVHALIDHKYWNQLYHCHRADTLSRGDEKGVQEWKRKQEVIENYLSERRKYYAVFDLVDTKYIVQNGFEGSEIRDMKAKVAQTILDSGRQITVENATEVTQKIVDFLKK